VYVKIMDRSKDISGGENISTVEAALFTHPAVAEATLVGWPDDVNWGTAATRAWMQRSWWPSVEPDCQVVLREQVKAMGSVIGS
jgi:acyl-coenzyme A synthetase/AMP-(fatty) acid ligase